MCATDSGLLSPSLEQCPKCRQFYHQVREHFDYLFDQHDFSLIHCEDGGNAPGCLLVLESSRCRLRFINDRGIPQLGIGTKEARVTPRGAGEGIHGWYELSALLDFLEKRPIRAPFLGERRPRGAQSLNLSEHLQRLSNRLKPHCNAVCEFMRLDNFRQRQEEFVHFLDKRKQVILQQIREQYPGQL